jgi:hypothetical protein
LRTRCIFSPERAIGCWPSRGPIRAGQFFVRHRSRYGKKPSLDRNAGVETYASLKPDRVVLKSAMRKSLGPGLEALGIAQLYLNLETPEDYFIDIANLGRLFGMEERAEAVRASTAKAELAPDASETGEGAAGSPCPGLLGPGRNLGCPAGIRMQDRLVEIAGGRLCG